MKHLLIAEDDDGLRKMMTTWLERIPDVKVTATADGAEAFRAIQAQKIDIVISDLNMPGVSGADLLRAVGEVEGHRPSSDILSGMRYYGPEDLLKLGAHAVFEKTQVSTLLKMIKASITNVA